MGGEGVPRRLLDAEDQLNRYAYRHVVPILLAPPAAPEGGMHNASGFLLRLPNGVYLGTAWHVVQHWIDQRARGAQVLFQLSDTVAINPQDSLAWHDAPNDLAFMRLTDRQAAGVDASICEPLPLWPPVHPTADSDLFISGFPGQIRQREGDRDVNFRSFTAHLIIQEVRDRYLGCVLDQDYLTDVDGNRIATADLNLGGMSGAPAFLLGQLAYPVVAIVTDCALGVIRLATLSHVDGLGRVCPARSSQGV